MNEGSTIYPPFGEKSTIIVDAIQQPPTPPGKLLIACPWCKRVVSVGLSRALFGS